MEVFLSRIIAHATHVVQQISPQLGILGKYNKNYVSCIHQQQVCAAVQAHSLQQTSADKIPIPYIATFCTLPASRTCKLVTDWSD